MITPVADFDRISRPSYASFGVYVIYAKFDLVPAIGIRIIEYDDVTCPDFAKRRHPE
jgi:hypothetical protein